ncbi:hypothetical protein F4813DRAFT_358590 [Daldinia decipiens]|uniref:uncharacterized protein n=1 Tax=Daldinia decipiens TaxID=326647 RepID=UPI0020C507AB|nr:uncharacterized protein F4813DRAFT_358590 [Daldinia decipiens]KAI1657965.1 hypothetical protein F4813DRAFT_358590 [Daldinia decipiens]
MPCNSNRSPGRNHNRNHNQTPTENHGGSPLNPLNRSANIDESQNTSVWVSNLPKDCTIHQLLAPIRQVGKIFFVHINPPNETFATSAAKITFWDRPSTEKFLRLVKDGKITIGGLQPAVRMNRIRAAPQPASNRSRVLVLWGSPSVVDMKVLEPLFRSEIEFEIDEVKEMMWYGERRLEIRFGSHRAQASRAEQMMRVLKGGRTTEYAAANLTPEQRIFLCLVRILWGSDPCELP